jgi:hypothetical protein
MPVWRQVDELLRALGAGTASPLLADAHITLLRLIQADMGAVVRLIPPALVSCWLQQD